MAKREDLLEKRFTLACKRKGIRTIKVDADKYNGFPDRIVFNSLVGEIHYIEFKNNTYYERTKNQKRWANNIEKCNGKYFLLDGDKDVDEYIEKHIENPKQETEEEWLKRLLDLTYKDGINARLIMRNMIKKRLGREE